MRAGPIAARMQAGSEGPEGRVIGAVTPHSISLAALATTWIRGAEGAPVGDDDSRLQLGVFLLHECKVLHPSTNSNEGRHLPCLRGLGFFAAVFFKPLGLPALPPITLSLSTGR